jgi:hypothetical protein
MFPFNAIVNRVLEAVPPIIGLGSWNVTPNYAAYQAVPHPQRVLIALHGFAMPAVVFLAPEAKTDPATGVFPYWEATPLNQCLLNAVTEAQTRWPNAQKLFLAGHSFGGRGVVFEGMGPQADSFNGFGILAPFMASPEDFPRMATTLANSGKPYYLAFDSDDFVAHFSPAEVAPLTALHLPPNRIIDHRPATPLGVYLRPNAHNELINSAAGPLLNFFTQIP